MIVRGGLDWSERVSLAGILCEQGHRAFKAGNSSGRRFMRKAAGYTIGIPAARRTLHDAGRWRKR